MPPVDESSTPLGVRACRWRSADRSSRSARCATPAHDVQPVAKMPLRPSEITPTRTFDAVERPLAAHVVGVQDRVAFRRRRCRSRARVGRQPNRGDGGQRGDGPQARDRDARLHAAARGAGHFDGHAGGFEPGEGRVARVGQQDVHLHVVVRVDAQPSVAGRVLHRLGRRVEREPHGGRGLLGRDARRRSAARRRPGRPAPSSASRSPGPSHRRVGRPRGRSSGRRRTGRRTRG